MSPLAKEVIEKLSHEEDVELLAEVLDLNTKNKFSEKMLKYMLLKL